MLFSLNHCMKECFQPTPSGVVTAIFYNVAPNNQFAGVASRSPPVLNMHVHLPVFMAISPPLRCQSSSGLEVGASDQYWGSILWDLNFLPQTKSFHQQTWSMPGPLIYAAAHVIIPLQRQYNDRNGTNKWRKVPCVWLVEYRHRRLHTTLLNCLYRGTFSQWHYHSFSSHHWQKKKVLRGERCTRD